MSEKTNREFRKIPSLLFLYEVNSDGSVIRNVKSKRHLKQFKKSHNSKTEYWCVQINLRGKILKRFIHNLVAECWLGDKPMGYQTDHVDRNSLNNDYRNLRYVTKSEQMKNRDYDSFMDKVWGNLAEKNGGVPHPVRLKKGDEVHEFPTMYRAAKYLVMVYPECKVKSFTDKLHLRRHHIFDYDIEYLNAETRHENLMQVRNSPGIDTCI